MEQRICGCIRSLNFFLLSFVFKNWLSYSSKHSQVSLTELFCLCLFPGWSRPLAPYWWRLLKGSRSWLRPETSRPSAGTSCDWSPKTERCVNQLINVMSVWRTRTASTQENNFGLSQCGSCCDSFGNNKIVFAKLIADIWQHWDITKTLWCVTKHKQSTVRKQTSKWAKLIWKKKRHFFTQTIRCKHPSQFVWLSASTLTFCTFRSCADTILLCNEGILILILWHFGCTRIQIKSYSQTVYCNKPGISLERARSKTAK